MSEVKERKFLEYPMVIDWLQWSDEFEEILGKPDMPQVTLTLISEMREEVRKLQAENERLRAALEFYADHKQMNHGFDMNEETHFVSEDDFESIEKIEPWEYREHEYFVYGKRARQALRGEG